MKEKRTIDENATNLLIKIYENDNFNDRQVYEGAIIQKLIDLSPDEINDAVDFLDERDLIDRLNWMGTHPFNFGQIELNSRGRHIYQELQKEINKEKESSHVNTSDKSGIIRQQPIAAGSPFGFTDIDWEYVQQRTHDDSKLMVVFGYQFKSEYYSNKSLSGNLRIQLQNALNRFNSQPGNKEVALEFKELGAGYGEHLFNQIARDIISSDIAIFETSDLNPNVMIELGVALTWGKRVLPIKVKGQDSPPSDISGQTWADYISNGEFVNQNHEEELYRMVERAIQKKLRGN
jgi:hypothetical protein